MSKIGIVKLKTLNSAKGEWILITSIYLAVQRDAKINKAKKRAKAD